MQFVEFDVPNSKTPVLINPAAVRTVRATNPEQKNTVIHFDGEHTATVVGAPQYVADRLSAPGHRAPF